MEIKAEGTGRDGTGRDAHFQRGFCLGNVRGRQAVYAAQVPRQAGRHSQDLWGQIAGRSPFLPSSLPSFLPFDANRRNGPKFYNQLVSLARPLVELINLAVSLLSPQQLRACLLHARGGEEEAS